MEKKDVELPCTSTKSDRKCKGNVVVRYSHGLVCMLLFLTCICILVATSSLALSLTQILARTDAEFSSGNCSGSIPESRTCNCSQRSNLSEIRNLIEQYRSLQMLVSELHLQIDTLTGVVKSLQNSSTAESCSYERCTVIEATVSDLTEEIANITSILNRAEYIRCESNDSSSTLKVVATSLDDEVQLYSNCTTTVEASCTISQSDGSSSVPNFGICYTPSVSINSSGHITTNAACIVSNYVAENGVREGNPIVASLAVDENSNFMHCICSVVVTRVPDRSTRRSDVTCSLSVTRCQSIKYFP